MFMTLLLQNPFLLPLLALAGVPLLVHLLSRTRPPEYRFSNTEFLRKILRRTARVRRPKDWLLLLLRTCALLALAAAFISPLLVRTGGSLPGETTTAILLIDRSASMTAREEAGSRFDNATSAAARFLEDRRISSANIVWIDAQPGSAFPEPGPNKTYLADLLMRATPAPEPGALAAAFDLALRQLSTTTGRREILVVSDFQTSAWETFSPSIPAGIHIATHQTASSAPANLSVTRLLSQPADPITGQEITVLATVRNFSPEPVRTQLTLDAGGARQTEPVDLSPWGETETAFTLRAAAPGELPVTASITQDAFPGDDARHSILHVRDAIRIVRPDAPENDPLARLASALSWLETSPSARPGDVIALSAWNGDPSSDLLAKAREGITILLIDPVSADFSSILPGLSAAPIESSPAGWKILPEESHPANRLFRNGDFGNPFSGIFRERLKLPATIEGTSRIAFYEDGVPAILEIPTSGAPILFFNLSLDPAKSDWPGQGTFLPALAEILLRTQPSSAISGGGVPPGGILAHSSDDPAHAGAITLLGPDSAEIPLRESQDGSSSLWQADSPATPGIHRWQLSSQTIAHTPVNFPETESDLRVLPSPPAFDNQSQSIDGLARRSALAQGLPLWPWLALAAALFLLSESIVPLLPRRAASSVSPIR